MWVVNMLNRIHYACLNLFVNENCFYTYDKRISWGKKFYGCTLFYYCMLKKKYGDYVEYYSGLRDQILNEFL